MTGTMTVVTITLRLVAGGLIGCRLVGDDASSTSISMGRRVRSSIRMAVAHRWGIPASCTQKANHAGTSTRLQTVASNHLLQLEVAVMRSSDWR